MKGIGAVVRPTCSMTQRELEEAEAAAAELLGDRDAHEARLRDFVPQLRGRSADRRPSRSRAGAPRCGVREDLVGEVDDRLLFVGE